jgi:Ala-tRNA(Pro) deacylase
MVENSVVQPQGEIIKQNILNILFESEIPYKLTVHEPVFSMEQAASVCNTFIKEGVKSLLIKTYKTKSIFDMTLVVWRGDRLVDQSLIAKTLNCKKAKMATPEEVKGFLGIEVGSLTSFGYTKNIPVIFDVSILENSKVFINPGKNTETIELSPLDLQKAISTWSNNQTIYVTSSE